LQALFRELGNDFQSRSSQVIMSSSLTKFSSLVGLVAIGSVAFNAIETQSETERLDAAGLKKLVTGLGYEAKDIVTEVGKEKFSVDIATTGFNVPVGVEIAPSKNYIWLTANVGKADAATKYEAMVKQNSKIQPSFFYVTDSGTMMVGLPVENHGVTPVWMKKCIDKLANDVSNSASVWQK
jgi:hypothetical protein